MFCKKDGNSFDILWYVMVLQIMGQENTILLLPRRRQHLLGRSQPFFRRKTCSSVKRSTQEAIGLLRVR